MVQELYSSTSRYTRREVQIFKIGTSTNIIEEAPLGSIPSEAKEVLLKLFEEFQREFGKKIELISGPTEYGKQHLLRYIIMPCSALYTVALALLLMAYSFSWGALPEVAIVGFLPQLSY